MNLSSKTIIFVLAGERELLKAIKDLSHTLGWFSKHRLYRDTYSNVAFLLQSASIVSKLQKISYDLAVIGKLTNCLVNVVLNLLAFLSELLVAQGFLCIRGLFVWWRISKSSSQG